MAFEDDALEINIRVLKDLIVMILPEARAFWVALQSMMNGKEDITMVNLCCVERFFISFVKSIAGLQESGNTRGCHMMCKSILFCITSNDMQVFGSSKSQEKANNKLFNV